MMQFIETSHQYPHKFNFGYFFSSAVKLYQRISIWNLYQALIVQSWLVALRYSKSFIRFFVNKKTMKQKIVNFSFKIFKMTSLRSSKCLKTKWISWGHPDKLTQKLATRQQRDRHDIFMLSLLLASLMLQSLKVFKVEKIHILKSLKINCSNAFCSSFMRLIFHKRSQYDS